MRKTVFITGSSSGIGRATVQLFLEKGWNIVASMRMPEKETTFKTSDTVLLVKLDVTDNDSIHTALKLAEKKFIKIDVVINNAGYGLLGPFEATTNEQILKQFQTNVFGMFNVTRAFIPHFKQHKNGLFINISSMMGRITFPFFSMYNASKWSVEGFSEALQYELQPFNIRIKVIEPGTIKTDFFSRSVVVAQKKDLNDYKQHFNNVITNIKKRGESGESSSTVAQCIMEAVNDSSDRFRYVPDRTAKLLLTLKQFLPLNMFTKIINKTVT